MRKVALVLLILWAVGAVAFAAEKKVFILAGQSNMVGFGSDASGLPTELQDPQTDVLFWYEEGPWNSVTNPNRRILSNAWIALQYQSDPNYGTFGGPVDGFGPEIKSGRVLADTLPEEIAIIKFAINATSIAQDWSATIPGPLYTDLTTIVSTAMTELTNLGHTGEIVGMFWMQGEWDALNATDAGNYQTNFTNFIQQVRIDFGTPDLPFIFGRLNSEIYQSPYGITQANLNTVRTAQENVASTVANTAMVNTDDLPLIGDFIHFSAAGQLLLGERFANEYLAMLDDPVPTLSEWGVAVMVILVVFGGIAILVRKSFLRP